MEITNWGVLLLSFLGGSLVGTLVKIIWDHRQQQMPIITYQLDIVPLLEDVVGEMRLSLAVDGQYYYYDNLYQVEVSVRNTWNRDFKTFDFGITTGEVQKIISQSAEGEDRHHVVSVKTSPHPAAPSSSIDYQLAPFNRKDEYTIRLSVTVPEAADFAEDDGMVVPDDIEISSPEAVRLRSSAETQIAISVGTAVANAVVSTPLASISFRR